ncbi:FG-GAP repeat domain-containing protein, partial [Bacteroidota bacterium]
MNDIPPKKRVRMSGQMFLSSAALVVSLTVTTATTTIAQPNFSRVITGATTIDRANSNGAAWIDFDGDDDLDLFVANIGASPNFLYENDGKGLLERVLVGPVGTDTRSSRGLCWADYDNSGGLDLFVTGSGVSPMLYRNDGLGDLQSVNILTTFGTTDLRGWACTWGDIDSDGYVDLVISHPAGFVGTPATSNHLFRNNGDGTFARISDTPVSMGFAPYTVPTFSDFDLDGDLDLFIGSGPANGVPGPDFLYRNLLTETGSADFERITDGPLASTNRDGQVINWIDYDNDRDLDAYVTNWGGAGGTGMRDELFRNDAGTVVPITEGAIVTDKRVSLSNLWADFDNDGDLDVFVTDGSGSGTNRLYDNNGDGTFRRLVTGPAAND